MTPSSARSGHLGTLHLGRVTLLTFIVVLLYPPGPPYMGAASMGSLIWGGHGSGVCLFSGALMVGIVAMSPEQSRL